MNTDLLFRYEEGNVTYEEFVELFQQIYDSKAYTWLQGCYGRTLQDLIQEGVIDV